MVFFNNKHTAMNWNGYTSPVVDSSKNSFSFGSTPTQTAARFQRIPNTQHDFRWESKSDGSDSIPEYAIDAEFADMPPSKISRPGVRMSLRDSPLPMSQIRHMDMASLKVKDHARALFSDRDMSKKFREVGVFYQGLNERLAKLSDDSLRAEAQINEAMTHWFRVRFHISGDGAVQISAKDYETTFRKLYAYSGRIQDPMVARLVLGVVDQLLNVGFYDSKKAVYSLSNLDLMQKTPSATLPLMAEPKVFQNTVAVRALGESLLYAELKDLSLDIFRRPLSTVDQRLVAMFHSAVAAGENERAIAEVCQARVLANPTLGLWLFMDSLKVSLPAEQVASIFEALNQSYWMEGSKTAVCFGEILNSDRDRQILDHLQLGLLVLGKIAQQSAASAVEMLDLFSDTFLRGAIKETLVFFFEHFAANRHANVPESDGIDDFSLGEMTTLGHVQQANHQDPDAHVLTVLQLPFEPTTSMAIAAAYSHVDSLFFSSYPDLADKLCISLEELKRRILDIVYAKSKMTIDAFSLVQRSTLDLVKLHYEEGLFRATRDRLASKYTETEKNVAKKCLHFYMYAQRPAVSDVGDIHPDLGLNAAEIHALYGVASTNGLAFDCLFEAYKLAQLEDFFVADLERLQRNDAVQTLICNRLRMDGSRHPRDLASRDAWRRFFSATLPESVTLSEGDLRFFDARREELPGPVRDRVLRGRYMQSVIGSATALNLKDAQDVRKDKALRRALIFEFARQGNCVFEDRDSDKGKRAAFRVQFLSRLNNPSADTKDAFLSYIPRDSEAFRSLMHTYENLRNSGREMGGFLDAFF